MNTWFTSDTHFWHRNILKYSNRPFPNIEEMNDKLVDNWNSVVNNGDTVYHLGDFSLGTNKEKNLELFNSLKGNKHLIRGNHEKTGRKLPWISQSDLLEIRMNGQTIVLCHYAMRVWNKSHHGSWHLYGHNHGSLPDDPNSFSFDVGVDCHNYFPLSFDDVSRIMKETKNART